MTDFYGIDTGASGAIVRLYEGPIIPQLEVWDMPTFEHKSGKSTKNFVEPIEVGNILAKAPPGAVAYIESVSAMPGQGVSSMFNFGRHYGIVLGALAALQIPVQKVSSGSWKRELGLGDDKDASCALAAKLFPVYAEQFYRPKRGGGVIGLDGRAEAALLAYYGKQRMAKVLA